MFFLYTNYRGGKWNVRQLVVCETDAVPRRVRFNAICNISSEWHTTDCGMRWDEDASSGAERPLGRVGTVDNIADAVMVLASDEASFITGDAIVVDGGGIAG